MYLAKNRAKNRLFPTEKPFFIFADYNFGYYLETFQEYDKIRIEGQGGEPFLANAPGGGALPAVFFGKNFAKPATKRPAGVYIRQA